MNNEEKQHVVIQNGQRVTGLLSEKEANDEAEKRRNRLNESSGGQSSNAAIEVKQNLCG